MTPATAAPGAVGLNDPLMPRKPHFPAKAKRVIFMFMAGGPSQLDLFDPKPKLQELHGQVIPESYVANKRFAFIKKDATLLGSKRKFERHGASGAEVSECLPHLATITDEIAILRAMKTDVFNHGPAKFFMNTGSAMFGRPSMGAWVTYGLGSEAEDLPGFVVLTSLGKGGQNQPIAGRQWSSGFLPSRYQGVQLRSKGEAVLYLDSPPGTSLDQQEADVAAIESAIARPT